MYEREGEVFRVFLGSLCVHLWHGLCRVWKVCMMACFSVCVFFGSAYLCVFVVEGVCFWVVCVHEVSVEGLVRASLC